MSSKSAVSSRLQAGAAQVDISPDTSQFLWGYPHVARMSTGIHDPIFASALFLRDGATSVIFIACDVLFISKDLALRARRRIQELTGVFVSRIVVSATHTHSAPKTQNTLSQYFDTVVPPADSAYVQRLEAAVLAWQNDTPAEAAFVEADAQGIGTNRHDPAGASDLRVPVLMLRRVEGGHPIAMMLTVCMHPTVLHEDSTLVSSDFPGAAREYLKKSYPNCPVIYQTGASGNQSPRHVTRGNTFEEAERLGVILGKAVESELTKAVFLKDLPLRALTTEIDLPERPLLSIGEASAGLQQAKDRFEGLKKANADRSEIRSAECDWFGAEKTFTLAQAAEEGKVREALAAILPAEIQVIAIGDWTYVTWPGETFVEIGLEIRNARPHTVVVTMANGELHGYLVTQEAVDRKCYEAGNALLASPAGGDCLVRATRAMLETL